MANEAEVSQRIENWKNGKQHAKLLSDLHTGYPQLTTEMQNLINDMKQIEYYKLLLKYALNITTLITFNWLAALILILVLICQKQ